MVKQVFLLDDATVRERIGDLVGLGFCVLDPAGAAVSARTIVVPTEALLGQFDCYLLELAARLVAAATTLDPSLHRGAPRRLDDDARRTILRAVDCCRNDAIGALELFFDETGLSRARRLDARRHLLSASHWMVTLCGMQHRYGLLPAEQAADGILADQMAATLLALMRQNFQTTRDDIAWLMQLGLFERRPGPSVPHPARRFAHATGGNPPAAPGHTRDHCAAVPEPQRRPRAGLFRGWYRRRHHHRLVAPWERLCFTAAIRQNRPPIIPLSSYRAVLLAPSPEGARRSGSGAHQGRIVESTGAYRACPGPCQNPVLRIPPRSRMAAPVPFFLSPPLPLAGEVARESAVGEGMPPRSFPSPFPGSPRDPTSPETGEMVAKSLQARGRTPSHRTGAGRSPARPRPPREPASRRFPPAPPRCRRARCRPAWSPPGR